MQAPAATQAAAIDVQNLVKVYPSGKKALNGVSFRVNPGEIFAFLGPNGSGKTTTIKVLTTLLAATQGTVKLNGQDLVGPVDVLRRSFGVVFQDSSLDEDLTALENMEYHAVLYDVPPEAQQQRIEHLLRLMNLWDRRNSFVREFSGGMKRRLEIARAFVHNPQIVFLDEPTLGLDPQTRNTMWENLRRMSQQENATVFFTTHYMEEAERAAQRIAVIDGGKIIAAGTPADLKAQTSAASLEDAFLALTGKAIRESEETSEQIKSGHGPWRH